ncbi:MAG: tetratricopeptide repeat protein [Oscillospiraceae bacterium]|nr:tetratricopeptide repeat protein [Oscillospiraceae bacterium]
MTENKTGALQPEDYVEPSCLLCGEKYGEAPVRAVPQQRIVEKLDEYMSRRDYAGAERHLLYWLEEARLGQDKRGQLLVSNELIGHYRKAGQRDEALRFADEALSLLKELDFEDSISAGTTYVNAATACNAFGENERALALFEKALAVYEGSERTQKHLLGGLYNNLALTHKALGNYAQAHAFYDKAMAAMGEVPGGVLEQAITCLNRADVVAAELGMEAGEERIFALLDEAWELLHDESAPHNGYYAFVCEKCAPSFGYYGYFAAAEELQQEAKAIYERD